MVTPEAQHRNAAEGQLALPRSAAGRTYSQGHQLLKPTTGGAGAARYEEVASRIEELNVGASGLK